jgi:hypothetical protein
VSAQQGGWHAAETELSGYVVGSTPPMLAASIEAHLLACAGCRARLARLAGETERTQAWERLADSIDRPSPRLVERLPGQHWLARSTIATPAMLWSALAAVVLVGLVPLLTALLAADAGLLALLIVAPLAPVAAVAIAYRGWADPVGEMSLAAPAAGLRLVAMRALVVSLVALPLSFAVFWVVDRWVEDIPMSVVAAWCLPGLALAALVLLAGTTRFDPVVVAAVVSAAWGFAAATAATVRRTLRPEIFIDIIASPAVQVAALVVALAALLLTAARRDVVAYRRVA